MHIRPLLGKLRWGAISALRQREHNLPEPGPVVSFTFDDFPRSALSAGGLILKTYGACGTYYAAMGLLDQVNALGQHFSAEDLRTLLRDGHELGSHTLRHLSCREFAVDQFLADVIQGKHAVEKFTGDGAGHQFSYPYGHATLRAKPRIGAVVTSCRGIVPGINESPVDLNLLRANHLYSHSMRLDDVGRLVAENERRRGWLIFYTHDICDKPSPFGCTPGQFESVVRLVSKTRARIVPVGQALSAGLPAEAPARPV